MEGSGLKSSHFLARTRGLLPNLCRFGLLRRFSRGRQDFPRLDDCLRLLRGLGREGKEQLLIACQVIEKRRQKSGFSCRRPQIIEANAGKSQKTVKKRGIRGEKV